MTPRDEALVVTLELFSGETYTVRVQLCANVADVKRAVLAQLQSHAVTVRLLLHGHVLEDTKLAADISDTSWQLVVARTRTEAASFAQLAERHELYREMLEHMRAISRLDGEMSNDELRLFSTASKRHVSALLR
mmetsp:Transcript_62195/g.136836  ORF Transcript_62195/g.136836 Transcript_62195/m.136836 type:complete len:134 (+) Transcript_62195:14-415(+)